MLHTASIRTECIKLRPYFSFFSVAPFFQYPDLILLLQIVYSVDYIPSNFLYIRFPNGWNHIFITLILFLQIHVLQFVNIILNFANLSFLYHFGLYVSCDLFNRVKIKFNQGRAYSGWRWRKYNSKPSVPLDARRGGWSTQYPSHFSSEKYPRSFVQDAVQIAGSFWRATENLATIGFDSRPSSLQPVTLSTELPRPTYNPVNLRNSYVYCQI